LKSQTARIQLVAIGGLVLFLAACSSVSDEETSAQFELTETYVVSDFDFSVDYPSGWLADTLAPVTIISELEEDHELALQEADFDAKGYQVTLDHRDMPFMLSLGLPENPTLDDLLELNRGFFDWEESIEVTELEIFGVRAYSVEGNDGPTWGISLMGIRGDEAFLFGFGAPSEEARGAFMPTWDRMLQSITLTE
jgi:hypothetical protein